MNFPFKSQLDLVLSKEIAHASERLPPRPISWRILNVPVARRYKGHNRSIERVANWRRGRNLQVSIAIAENVATGRAIAAARVLLGLDQTALAALANLSAATISNVERGHVVRDETMLAIQKAIRRRGATITIDRNGFASVAILFHQPRMTQRTPRTASLKNLNY